MSVNTKSDYVDDRDVEDIISCVALYYQKGKSGSSFLRKEKFRAQLPRKVKTIIPSLDGEANFLLGTVSRFGRSIRFNNRILF